MIRGGHLNHRTGLDELLYLCVVDLRSRWIFLKSFLHTSQTGYNSVSASSQVWHVLAAKEGSCVVLDALDFHMNHLLL